jgi:UDP:flavonoid glycosyltransferase YjiC (YdhE family)
MKITLVCSGSRGDVQPFVALGLGLHRAGYDLTIATHEEFRGFVAERGLPFALISGDPKQMLESEEGRKLLESGSNGLLFFRRLAKLAEPLAVEFMRDAVQVCADADLILCSTSIFFGGEALAEKLRKPLVYASLQPMAPSSEQPGMMQRPLPWPFDTLSTSFGYNWLAQWISLQLYASLFAAPVNTARQTVLGLPKRSFGMSTEVFRTGPMFLYGYSPSVVPKPGDWSPTQHVCGYWFLDQLAGWTPSPELKAFLEAGPPPVYIGFGSMNSRDPQATGRLAIEALERSGQRGILLRGWGGLHAEDVPGNIFLIDSVPHDWLFPRMSAVVHHGGAGTTSAGLRAGVPSVIVPFMADQPFWGRRVQALGVGPQPLPRERLTSLELSIAIRQGVTDETMKSNAARLGERIRAEDGIAEAVRVLQLRYPLGARGVSPVVA